MTVRRPYLLATALWLAMVVCFFSPVVFQGKVIAPLDIMDSLLRPWATRDTIHVHNAFTYDAISQYLPYDWSIYQSLRADGYIGWNPYTHSGTAIVENTMLCPGDWHHHLYRFLPFWTSWNAGIIFQFTIAGLGMLALLRDRKVSACHAMIGAVAFGFYSQFVLWIHHRWVLGAMCWAPWILWSLLRMRPARRMIDVPSVVFIALAFRGGHLQACLFVVLLVMIIALADWWQSPERWRPAVMLQRMLPYAVCGLLGTLLALDVLMETVPALLHGKREMASRTWVDTLMALPTLITSVFPTLMGTPQGLDVTKLFRIDLFSIKFMGAVPLFLALAACFRKDAPVTAKFLLVTGLLAPFTPADEWLYSRFTVVFALGAAWLASWHLAKLSEEAPSRLWRKAGIALALVAGGWLLASGILSANRETVREKLRSTALSKLPSEKNSRKEWMLGRSDEFLSRAFIWHPGNLAMLSLAGAGLFACSRIHNLNPRASRYAITASLLAFGEMSLFASTWITFSNKPDGGGLYARTPWMDEIKQQVQAGTILCHDRSDFDFMQLNTPSSYGIRFAEGYETVTPRRIDPGDGRQPDSTRCAKAGISHLLVPPGTTPTLLSGWQKVIDCPDLGLYRNSDFISEASAEREDGSTTPISCRMPSPNRREIDLPRGTRSVTLLESYNPGWRFSMDGNIWLPVTASENHAIHIALPDALAGPTTLSLRYRPALRAIYRPIIALTLVGLAALLIQQSRKPIPSPDASSGTSLNDR